MAENTEEPVDADILALREKYLNQDFDEKTFEVDPAKTAEFALLSGETLTKFLDPAHPDFQAPPTWVACLSGGRSLPADFPRFGVGMDGGKAVFCFKPVRPGVPLTGRTHLHDIYTKTGRSGRMVFVVSRIEFYDPDGNHLANSDSRMVMREKGKRMTIPKLIIQKLGDVEFGAELPAFEPDTSLPKTARFAEIVGWGMRGPEGKFLGGRFNDHEAARKEGFPGALVPGIMSQGFLVAMIHKWAPTAEIRSVDTVFRSPVVADEPCKITGVVTDIKEDELIVEIDLTVANEKGETRVFGTAQVFIPA